MYSEFSLENYSLCKYRTSSDVFENLGIKKPLRINGGARFIY